MTSMEALGWRESHGFKVDQGKAVSRSCFQVCGVWGMRPGLTEDEAGPVQMCFFFFF